MTISIKQVNGDLIPVTMQGDLAIHPDLPPLQDISVVGLVSHSLVINSTMSNPGGASSNPQFFNIIENFSGAVE